MPTVFNPPNKRPNSIAIMGGAFGDEGKGRIVDEFVSLFLKSHNQVIQYRDNGGANAGHTVEVGATRIALHQIGSGILQAGCTVISGKDMVVHPQDLVTELNVVKKKFHGKIPATYILDELTVLSLDTHRALENVLKTRISGSKGSTGRGIAPAYADIIYRQPLRARDYLKSNWQEAFTRHYQLYTDLVKGLGGHLASTLIARSDQKSKTGSLTTFLQSLNQTRSILKPYIHSVAHLLETEWSGKTPFVFEKAQALGLDSRFGVYPDVTASDCSFQGILSSTQGIVNPQQIALKTAVIKTTYTSSVGIRHLPSSNHHLTDRIRKDAFEFGATTGRPRDIHYLDIPLISYLMHVGGVEYLCPTHLDISYPKEPIKVVVAYQDKRGQRQPYRPDQEYLLTLKPVFKEFPSWDGALTQIAKKPKELPPACLAFLKYLTQTLNVKLLLATTGPKRHQTINWF